ncbi:hypothetical protein M409DRAFT_56271 [Zasmidium cellare ATCC 36951]|uniref:Uncharacterized protein n=1 Tax=Zasmidium cellare ATCC 36951 TaxID=1080233 RepID=A0A6A6CCJ6_ZASCE|nr:uncharacterized protein M409DRAFT_56271 [Zasmidium cellare ATCC 36951]KAF2164917.1 hypothetical protein M409DRAFT_56271 [Zasmidium cellare ATCC 36951]
MLAMLCVRRRAMRALDAIHASPNQTLVYRRPSDPRFLMVAATRTGQKSKHFKTYMYDDSRPCTPNEIATALTSVARLGGAYDAAGGYAHRRGVAQDAKHFGNYFKATM